MKVIVKVEVDFDEKKEGVVTLGDACYVAENLAISELCSSEESNPNISYEFGEWPS